MGEGTAFAYPRPTCHFSVEPDVWFVDMFATTWSFFAYQPPTTAPTPWLPGDGRLWGWDGRGPPAYASAFFSPRGAHGPGSKGTLHTAPGNGHPSFGCKWGMSVTCGYRMVLRETLPRRQTRGKHNRMTFALPGNQDHQRGHRPRYNVGGISRCKPTIAHNPVAVKFLSRLGCISLAD